MKRKGARLLLTPILFGIAALISIAGCVRTLRYGQLEFLQFLDTAIFTAAFTVHLCRYLNSRAEEEK